MDKNTIEYQDFLAAVALPYQAGIDALHQSLTGQGCKVKIEPAKSGYVVSYHHPKDKRVLLNFVFRKSGLVARIYGDGVNSYLDFMATLPPSMLKAVDKASACKRLLDITACNSRCAMGYDFMLEGVHYQKCRYGAFMFPVDDETLPFITDFVGREAASRAKGA